MKLDSYLHRINYSGPINPDLDTLEQLQLSHLLSVPFENLDIHQGREIQLDLNKIYHKIVEEKRGGFCYELNGLFFHFLQELDFNATRISARVHSTEKQSYGPEFDHFAIIAHLEEKDYLVDVGYGEFLLTPLQIELDKPQEDALGALYVLRQHDDSYLRVEKQVEGGWKPEYIFTLQARDFREFQPMCDYQQYDPGSHFQKQKLISQLTETGRITLTSTKLKVQEGGQVVEREVKDDEAFDQLLWHYFHMRL